MSRAILLGHLGLLFGLLAVVWELQGVAYAVIVGATGPGPLLLALMVWVLGLVFVAGGYFEANRAG